MFSINKYCWNFKPGIPLSKDFRNEVIQMAATRPASEIRERYRMYRCFNGCRTSNVWLPSLSCLRPVRTCFSVTCPCLDENDGSRMPGYSPGDYKCICQGLENTKGRMCCYAMTLVDSYTIMFCHWSDSYQAFHCLKFFVFCLSTAVAMESAGFMNALTSAASAAPVVRKRKRASTAAKVHVVSCFLSGHFKNVIFLYPVDT